MGGRGASYKGSSSTGNSDRKSNFYEVKKFKGMSLHEFENSIRDKDIEYLGLVDNKGNIITAGTSYNKGSVSIPTSHPEFSKAVGMTHNHPYSDGRSIGGTFSGADIKGMLTFNHEFVRAVTNGKNENTYILKRKTNSNSRGLYKYADKMTSDSKIQKRGNAAIKKVREKLSKQGKSLTRKQENQIFLGVQKHVWKNKIVKDLGFDYVEVKKSRW